MQVHRAKPISPKQCRSRMSDRQQTFRSRQVSRIGQPISAEQQHWPAKASLQSDGPLDAGFKQGPETKDYDMKPQKERFIALNKGREGVCEVDKERVEKFKQMAHECCSRDRRCRRPNTQNTCFPRHHHSKTCPTTGTRNMPKWIRKSTPMRNAARTQDKKQTRRNGCPVIVSISHGNAFLTAAICTIRLPSAPVDGFVTP